ncbi:MAG: TRAP transporter small permease subunit [Gammaproteobacteria bacterium]|nr:TRAP transporter small permease subunit [Gammaproteobacteria bacterium]MCP4088736.1 TRAP transporter small permease subunit [Gammaproteobacteria bacterium]MCP4275221.1 TRAP transporter small permease subunit [Gammaproteobacteria bacterium]MCP4830769.1 TRAP transporter small permease subunit [Gammaproteobacteria bacterium]MCP4929558.1 TRAP transporter small permease subunit [Gammaproteobacteria bacterium]
MLTTADQLEAITRSIGQLIAWLTLALVIVTSIVVVQRYLFNAGSIRMQESITFMHAAIFMLTAAYTLSVNDHVRVDVFYSVMSARGKALVNLVGTLFLLMPFCAFMLYSSWDFVGVAWSVREASQESGGLPFPFPGLMKSFIPLASGLLIMQGTVIILRSLVTLAKAEHH